MPARPITDMFLLMLPKRGLLLQLSLRGRGWKYSELTRVWSPPDALHPG